MSEFIPYDPSVFQSKDATSGQGFCCVCRKAGATWMKERIRGSFFAYCAKCRQSCLIKSTSVLARAAYRLLVKYPSCAGKIGTLLPKAPPEDIFMALAELRSRHLIDGTNFVLPPEQPPAQHRPTQPTADPKAWYIFLRMGDRNVYRWDQPFRTRKAALAACKRMTSPPLAGATGAMIGRENGPSTKRLFSTWNS